MRPIGRVEVDWRKSAEELRGIRFCETFRHSYWIGVRVEVPLAILGRRDLLTGFIPRFKIPSHDRIKGRCSIVHG